jgi:processive 1,2-diacylglycerol beta-glucosyltransferase
VNSKDGVINKLSEEAIMIQLRDKESGSVLGSISEDDLQFLIDNLEEESEDDVDYYLNRSTLEMFKEKGMSPALLKVLENAFGGREDIEIEWSRLE